MKIDVFFNLYMGEALCHVASVDVPEEINTIPGALEYAWRYTNNVEGSWSRKDMTTFEHEGRTYQNGDLCEHVTVLKDLPRARDGRLMGHRSSMVGDRYVVDDRVFEVDVFGFKEVP